MLRAPRLPAVTFDLLPSHPLRALSSALAVLDLEDGYLDIRDPGKTMNARDLRIPDPDLMVCLPFVLL